MPNHPSTCPRLLTDFLIVAGVCRITLRSQTCLVSAKHRLWVMRSDQAKTIASTSSSQKHARQILRRSVRTSVQPLRLAGAKCYTVLPRRAMTSNHKLVGMRCFTSRRWRLQILGMMSYWLKLAEAMLMSIARMSSQVSIPYLFESGAAHACVLRLILGPNG